MATACLSVLHWCYLLMTAWGGWTGTSPITLLGYLALTWLLGIVVVLVTGLLHGGRPASLLGVGFCVLGLGGQMLFELWLLGAIIASV